MRRALALAAFVGVVLASIGSAVILGRIKAVSPDWPEYPEFLAGVAAHTAPGDSIALLAPARRGTNDYAYAYFRASYFLAGREVLPVVVDDQLVPENAGRTQFVAMWRGRIASSRPVIWRGHGGELLGR